MPTFVVRHSTLRGPIEPGKQQETSYRSPDFAGYRRHAAGDATYGLNAK
jgi:hypothetical protein